MGAAHEAIKGDTIRVERNRMESLDGKLEGQEALVMAAIQLQPRLKNMPVTGISIS
jgi:hypothetical protein